MKAWTLIALLATAVAVSGCATRVDRARALLTQYELADQAYDRNDCVTAIPLYRDLAGKMKADTKSLLRIGNCHARNRNWVAAAAAYRQALQRDRTYLAAWYNLSYIQARVLQDTVVNMLEHVKPHDPASRRIMRMAEQVLKPYQLDVAGQSVLKDDNRKPHDPAQ